MAADPVSFSDHARRFGYGTDPDGDAARRRAMGHARVTPEELEQLRQRGAIGGDRYRRLVDEAVRDSLRKQADRILADARRMGVDPPPPEVDPEPVPGHRLTPRRGSAGTEVSCECGRWEGWFNGPRSRRRVMDDHAAHVAAELSAAGPIKVESVRLDQPKELP